MKKFVVCIDSDGCAMDTMTLKHEEYFGPYAAEALSIKNKKAFENEWNIVNLYSLQRGINRFESFALFADKYSSEISDSIDISPLLEWVSHTDSLSEASIENELAKNPSKILQIALAWSKRVNESIAKRDSKDYKAFDNVAEVMNKISKLADIVVVSSANKKAVLEEWENNGILKYTTVVNTQENGSKRAIVKSVLDELGDVDSILMVGDATKDRDAALDNGVLYYPILAKHEATSWKELGDTAFNKFLDKTYRRELQLDYLEKFVANLN